MKTLILVDPDVPVIEVNGFRYIGKLNQFSVMCVDWPMMIYVFNDIGFYNIVNRIPSIALGYLMQDSLALYKECARSRMSLEVFAKSHPHNFVHLSKYEITTDKDQFIERVQIQAEATFVQNSLMRLLQAHRNFNWRVNQW